MSEAVLAVLVIALLGYIAWQDRAHGKVVADLLQRIQAPERAVVEHGDHVLKPSPPPISLLSDEEWQDEMDRRELETRS